MTVTATNVGDGPFYPNGVTTNFPFTFEVAETGEVVAFLNGEELDSSLFSVTLNDDGTGEVVFFTAPAGDGVTDELFLFSDPVFSQETSLNNQGPYFQSTLEALIDRLAMRSLWLRDRVNRSLKLPVGESAPSFPDPADRQSTVLGFDALGVFGLLGGSAFKGDPGGNVESVGNFSAIDGMTIDAGTTSIRVSDRDQAVLIDATAEDLPTNYPAGEGIWWTHSNADARQWRLNNAEITTKHLGGVHDGVTDNTDVWVQLAVIGQYLDRQIVISDGGEFCFRQDMMCYDNMRLRCDGDYANIMLNTDGDFVYGKHFIFTIGNMFGGQMAASSNVERVDLAASITANSQTFSVALADVGKVAVGDILTFYDHASLISAGATDVPFTYHTSIVETFDAGTGAGTFKHPCPIAIGGTPKLVNWSDNGGTAADLQGRPVRWVKNVVITGKGRGRTAYEKWTGYGGMIDCHLEINIADSYALFACNGLAHSYLDVSGYARKGVETAYLSENSTVTSSRGWFIHTGWNGPTFITANECSRDMLFRGIRAVSSVALNSGVAFTGSVAPRIAGDCVFDAPSYADNPLSVNALTGGYDFGKLRVDDGARFYGDAPVAIKLINTGTGTVDDAFIGAARFEGTFSTQATSITATRAVLKGTYIETGNWIINANSGGVRLEDIESAAERAISDNGSNTVMARCFRSALGENFIGDTLFITLADDEAASFRLPITGSKYFGRYSVDSNAGTNAEVSYNAGTPSVAAIGTPSADINVVTGGGVLSGTTGTDTKTNLSVGTDRRGYIENRSGGGKTYAIRGVL